MLVYTSFFLLITWSILSSVGFLYLAFPKIIGTMGTTVRLGSLNKFFKTFFDWWLLTMAYSLLFFLALALAAWTNNPFVLLAVILGYMAIGVQIGRMLGVKPKVHLVFMAGLPPLQAAVIIVNRKPAEGE